MHFPASTHILAALLPLIPLVTADFELWQATCDTGLGDGTGGFSNYAIVEVDSFSCDGGGCSAAGGWSSGGSPCEEDCSKSKLSFKENGNSNDMDIYNEDGQVIGYCENPGDDQKDEDCHEWNYSCYYWQAYICYTDRCT